MLQTIAGISDQNISNLPWDQKKKEEEKDENGKGESAKREMSRVSTNLSQQQQGEAVWGWEEKLLGLVHTTRG